MEKKRIFYFANVGNKNIDYSNIDKYINNFNDLDFDKWLKDNDLIETYKKFENLYEKIEK